MDKLKNEIGLMKLIKAVKNAGVKKEVLEEYEKL